MGTFDPAGMKRSRPRPPGLVYWRLEIQIPLRSGWPSDARGAEALRLGLPSLVRGVPGNGRLIHWACAVTARPRARNRLVTRFESFMTALSRAVLDRYAARNANVVLVASRPHSGPLVMTPRRP